MSLPELIEAYNFDSIHSTSQVRYDLEKLTWINHKWIAQYDLASLTNLCKPYLEKEYNISQLSHETLQCLVKAVQTDMQTLQDIVKLVKFYFNRPKITKQELSTTIDSVKIDNLISMLTNQHGSWEHFSTYLKDEAKKHNISNKELFSSIRILLTGNSKGLQIHDLFVCLGQKEFFARLTTTQ